MRDDAPLPPLSGRFLLRIDPGLHASLRRSAAAMGLSLNELCARKLAAPVGDLSGWAGAVAAVRRAAAVMGEALVGVVGYGSWARGELRAGSDVDLLVVVEHGVEVTRALYREWDEAPVEWDGHPVEPHFVHLPQEGQPPTGLWAEAAVEGIVLFARDFELSARLVAIRVDIADGRLVRRFVQGQPYWVEAA